MLRHPMEKRRNAETRVKSSTWWERICVEMLYNVLSVCSRKIGATRAYRHWKIPSAPRPKPSPRTGK